jgi:crotonobetainyl-CoA:carnitine CoA-transferase CaiB-like acyl-CoA transferase
VSGDRLLAGLTVVETGDGIAGSVAAATLASLGATVHKVLGPDRRHLDHPPFVAGPEGKPVSAITATLDRAKRLVPPDRAESLVVVADIVIVDIVDGVTDDVDSGVPGAGDHAGARVTISPYGLTGPYAGRRGGELVAAAAGGLLGTVEPEGGGRPVSTPGFIALRCTGAIAALAALHGLDERRRTGAPVDVDVSAQEAVVFVTALPECAHVLFDCPGRAGSGRYVAPSGLFPCTDGFVRITAVENHQWQGMVAALGAPPWTQGLDDRPARAEHAATITARVADWTRPQDKSTCADLLQHHGVPATGVNPPSELRASPQLAHRGALTRGGELKPPWRLRLTGPRSAVPTDDGSKGGDGTDDRTGSGLAGLRVVELTHVLAGPIVGALLGGMGARAVRVEDRDRLDIYRRTGPFAAGIAGPERGAYFAVANHSKSSVAVAGDQVDRVTHRLLADADVLIENVGRSRLDRLGVDPAAEAQDGRLTLHVSGFGTDGPLARYRVYANNVQSYGGLAWMTRDHAGAIARLGTVLADPLSSVAGATVVAAWALGPARTCGGIADLAMAEVVASTVAEYVAAAAAGTGVDPPAGNDLAPYAPHGVYRTADDRWIALAVHDDDEWSALVAVLGAPGLARDEWRRAETRFVARHQIDAELDRACAHLEAAGLADRLDAACVRAAVVARGADLVTDAHLASRGFFPEVAHPDPGLGTARIVGLPWRFSGRGPLPLAGPPALGSTPEAHAVEAFRAR